MKYEGGCHCGAVKFTVEAPEIIEALACNCSICTMTGFLHLIVPKSKFKLQSGQDQLSTYTFNTGQAQHLFCQICGIKSFYIPRSNPNGYSVNVRCLNVGEHQVVVQRFDGQNWEQNAENLVHLSEEKP